MSAVLTAEPASRVVIANGRPGRIWEKGTGKKIFWLSSAPMLLRWTEIHETLAAGARLVVCSLPGFPGGEGHDSIDDHLSWCLAAKDLLEAAGFQVGDTLLGSSTAGALAADIAALWPQLVGKLILIAPCGIYDPDEPTRDMFALQPKEAPTTLAQDGERYTAQVAVPEGSEPVLWTITTVRGNEAAARFLWPLGNTRVAGRLHRVTAPTLLIWGEADRILPPSYAERFARAIGGNASVVKLAGAGHLAELDQPAQAGAAVLQFAGR